MGGSAIDTNTSLPHHQITTRRHCHNRINLRVGETFWSQNQSKNIDSYLGGPIMSHPREQIIDDVRRQLNELRQSTAHSQMLIDAITSNLNLSLIHI